MKVCHEVDDVDLLFKEINSGTLISSVSRGGKKKENTLEDSKCTLEYFKEIFPIALLEPWYMER